jgi:hypothetical protein
MAITTLVQFWQQERDIYEVEQTAAQNDVTAAQAAVTAAQTKLADDVAGLDKLKGDIAAARAKLATTTVPAEVAALNDKIRDLIIQQRGLQGVVLDDHDALEWAQADLDAGTGTLGRATAKLADAEAKLGAAKDAHRQRQALRSALTLPPYDTLKDDATTFLNSATFNDAEAQIGADFPADLLKIALKRFDTRTARAADLRTVSRLAEDALGTDVATDAALDGAVQQKGIAFRRAERDVREYLATAKIRYDQAVAVLQHLQAIKNDTTGANPDLLTAAEKAAVAVNPDFTAAEGAAEPIDTARKALFTALGDLDAQILKQIGSDVDALSTDATVKAKRDLVKTAWANLRSAEAAFVVAVPGKQVMDRWEAVVPDPAWQALLDFFAARAALNELKSIAPTGAGSITATMDSAESDYAGALAIAAKAKRRVDYYDDAVAVRTERLDAATHALGGRLLSAVRGDSF